MVMKPEPWGEALDAVATDDCVVIVPTPSGTPFTQAAAERLSGEQHLVFACGRYEGIDQRVIDHAATPLAGRGDLARRLRAQRRRGGRARDHRGRRAAAPGLHGQPGVARRGVPRRRTGLLEYPVYTKPASWRGLDVPDVLLSGHHEQIAAWRLAQARARTADRRPDLLP